MNLTQEEKQLLDIFRDLNKEGRSAALCMASGLLNVVSFRARQLRIVSTRAHGQQAAIDNETDAPDHQE